MEAYIAKLNSIIVISCQLLAIFVISIGISKAIFVYIRDSIILNKSYQAIADSRKELGSSFSLGLGFLIGGSILKTTIAPNWTEIGQLATIIAIRTFLNFFLVKEVEKHEENANKSLIGNAKNEFVSLPENKEKNDDKIIWRKNGK